MAFYTGGSFSYIPTSVVCHLSPIPERSARIGESIQRVNSIECDATCNLFARVPQLFGLILLLGPAKRTTCCCSPHQTLLPLGPHPNIPSILLSRLPTSSHTTLLPPPAETRHPKDTTTKMAEEPTLPTLPRARRSNAAPKGLSSRPRLRRKRQSARGVASLRDENSSDPPVFSIASPAYANSSDPPVFSSDDSPALDNYTDGDRHKRQYVGAWFNQQPVLSSDASMDSGMGGMGEEEEPKMLRPAKRRLESSTEPAEPRKLRRQLDSGVWLAIDDFSSTDTEELEEPEMRPGPARLVLNGPPLFDEEQEAQRLVRRCQDEGNESVDLKYVSTSSFPGFCENSELTIRVTVRSTSGPFPILPSRPSITLRRSHTLTRTSSLSNDSQPSGCT